MEFAGRFDEMWASMGIQPAQTAGGELPEGVDPESYMFNTDYDFGKGTTNSDLVSQLGSLWTTSENNLWDAFSNNGSVGGAGNTWGDSKYTASFDDPGSFMEAFRANNPGAVPEWTDLNQKLANNVWSKAGDVYSDGIPAGYAAPI